MATQAEKSITNSLWWLAIAGSIVTCIPCPASGENKEATKPFFSEHCVKCHGPDKQKGDIRLDNLPSKISAENVDVWLEVVHNLQRGDMPPDDEPQPNDKKRRDFLAKIMP